MELRERFAGVLPNPGSYIEAFPFASAGETCIHLVRLRSEMSVDLVEGVVVERRGVGGTFIPNKELAAFSDLIKGIVQRGKL